MGFPIRAELGKRTGRVTVPSIWIGECVTDRKFVQAFQCSIFQSPDEKMRSFNSRRLKQP